MSIRKRKVKYDCVRYGSFNISFRTYVHILCINTLLWIKRQYRRIKRGFGYVKVSFLLVPIWAVFIVAVYFWSKQRGTPVSIEIILWEMKSGVFTSIVLAAATSFISQYSITKDYYIVQHNYYINMMSIFSELYESLLILSGKARRGTKPPFDPFYYSENLSEQIRDVFPLTIDPKDKLVEARKTRLKIEKTRKIISKMLDMVSSGKIDGCTYSEYVQIEDFCDIYLDIIEDALIEEKPVSNWDVITENCIEYLYDLLELVRKPWRRDLKYKLDVLNSIYKEDKSVACTYYLEAFLGVVDYEFYNKTPEEIIEDLIRNNLVTDPNEEIPPGWVRVEITHRKAKSQPTSLEKDNEVTTP